MKTYGIEIIDRPGGWFTAYVTDYDGNYLAEAHGQGEPRKLVIEVVQEAFGEKPVPLLP